MHENYDNNGINMENLQWTTKDNNTCMLHDMIRSNNTTDNNDYIYCSGGGDDNDCNSNNTRTNNDVNYDDYNK
jgi:hypothetical protein